MVPNETMPRVNLTGRIIRKHRCILKGPSPHLQPPPGSTVGVSAAQAKLRADAEAELEHMKAEVRRRRRAESELIARVSHLERTLLEYEELLQQAASSPGNGSVAAALEKGRLRSMKEQLGKERSESLRAVASVALAEFEVHLATRLRELCRYAVAEKCDCGDRLFIRGYVKNSRLLLCMNMNLPE